MTTKYAIRFRGRWVEDITIDGIDTRDYPDFVDAYVASATWAGTEEELTDSELDALTDDLYSDGTLNDMAHNEVF